MNFSTSKSSKDLIKSLHHWWSLAGVDDDFNKEPVSLLADPVETRSQPIETRAPKVQNRPKVVPENSPVENFPNDHSNFILWLSQGDNLIEKNWAKNYIIKYLVIPASQPSTVTVYFLSCKMGKASNRKSNSCFLN